MLRLVIILVALASGGGAAWLAAQQTAPAAPPAPVVVTPAPEPTDMTEVLVAAQDVARGAQITADALRWQAWPQDAVPSAFVERMARPDALTEIAAHFARRPIAAGEPITDPAVTAEPNGFLAATLAAGRRAVAIEVDAQSTAGGFILPNDRVDVLHTLMDRSDRDSVKAQTRTLLRNVRVLAIDQTTAETEAGTVLGKTATLELAEHQVEAVTAAGSTGTLSLSLRPLADAQGEASLQIETPRKTIRVRRGTEFEDVAIN